MSFVARTTKDLHRRKGIMLKYTPKTGPKVLIFFLLILAAALIVFRKDAASTWRMLPSSIGAHEDTSSSRRVDPKLHLLLPATKGDINLCKTILTASALGYPKPTVVAWNQTFDQSNLYQGGSHMGKISGVLEYLEALDASAEDELVLMIDAYDIWFQLRLEVLIDRYYAINAQANERLRERLGSAYHAENLQQTVIFAAEKACAPNQAHTVACYAVPESPLPADLYGPNTDTGIGRSRTASNRQRWLNSGYVIGPVRDMRKVFRRAHERMTTPKQHSEWDNGSGSSDLNYHGSDQSVFNTMFGEQEYEREVMRRRHRSSADFIRGIGKAPNHDPINPKFTHEPMDYILGKSSQFSMGLDYFSQLGQQTSNARTDSSWIRHDRNITQQVKGRGHFDCPSHATSDIPEDIRQSRPPYVGQKDPGQRTPSWREVTLYKNLCLDSIPVMVHNNGEKAAREYSWPKLWLQPYARRHMESVQKNPIAHADGNALNWKELCPREFEAELYRDAQKHQQ